MCLTLSYQEHTKGVSSGYLAGLSPGDVVRFTHQRSNHERFCLPEKPMPDMTKEKLVDLALIPVVMFSTGTGIAPFRAMIQDRSEQAKKGVSVGKMMLFFGCSTPDTNYLYGESDLKAWVEQGILDVRPAFSQKSEDSFGCKYVQQYAIHFRFVWKLTNRRLCVVEFYMTKSTLLRNTSRMLGYVSTILMDAAALTSILQFLTCGSVDASKGLLDAGKEILVEVAGIDPKTAEDLILKSEKYVTDVFG
jgi:hypothetical protein